MPCSDDIKKMSIEQYACIAVIAAMCTEATTEELNDPVALVAQGILIAQEICNQSDSVDDPSILEMEIVAAPSIADIGSTADDIENSLDAIVDKLQLIVDGLPGMGGGGG